MQVGGRHARTATRSSGTFVKTLPNTVLYPSSANWTATVLPAVKQTIGTAVTGDPAKVLGDLQDKAKSGS